MSKNIQQAVCLNFKLTPIYILYTVCLENNRPTLVICVYCQLLQWQLLHLQCTSLLDFYTVPCKLSIVQTNATFSEPSISPFCFNCILCIKSDYFRSSLDLREGVPGLFCGLTNRKDPWKAIKPLDSVRFSGTIFE